MPLKSGKSKKVVWDLQNLNPYPVGGWMDLSPNWRDFVMPDYIETLLVSAERSVAIVLDNSITKPSSRKNK